MNSEGSFGTFERGRNRMLRSAIFSRFERYTSPHTNPQGNAFRLAIQALRVLIVFLVRRFFQGPGRGAALSELSKLRNIASGKEVLVVGSGPSASDLSPKTVTTLQKSGSLIVIAANYFLMSTLGKKISPDYLVWADEIFHPRNREVNPAWRALAKNSSVKVIAPWTWKRFIDDTAWKDRFLYFDDDSLEGWTRNISPLRPRGYQGSTGVKALAIAIHMSPIRSLVIGLDLSNFQSLKVNSQNEVIRQPAHISGADSGSQSLDENSLIGIADIVYSAANEFRYLRSHFAGQNVVNIGQASLVDAFRRQEDHPLTGETRK